VFRQAAAERLGQQCDYRTLDECVKHPKHRQCNRQSEYNRADQGVAEMAVRPEAKKVFEIRSKGSDHNGGRYYS
jgi:hypothetical protein